MYKFDVVNDYENLKKKYGERFAKFCRSNFSSILEQPGLLSYFIEDNFIPNKSLYDDLVSQNMQQSFIKYVYDYLNLNYDEPKTEDKVKESPSELLKKEGYILYECKTNFDVQKFKKYYKEDEELCTFRDPKRIKTHHIFFAVKDNVDEIKRENFNSPKRQDEYGTSVISIQFDKSSGRLSIKNRYNHTVNNPDATFSNNLNNIVPGLTASFEQHYNLEIQSGDESFELEGYTLTNEGEWCKFNLEENIVYYCDNNRILIEGNIYQFDKNKYLLIDSFLIDKENKTLIDLNKYSIIKNEDLQPNSILTKDNFNLVEKEVDYCYYDSFPNLYTNIDKIEITKQANDERLITIVSGGETSYMTIDKNSRIIKYQNNYITEIKNDFLLHARYLKSFTAKKLERVGDRFCYYARNLKHIDFPVLEKIGGGFMCYSEISNIRLPKVKSVGISFNGMSVFLKSLSAPNLLYAGESFLTCNTMLKSLSLPKLETIREKGLMDNYVITDVNLPNVKYIGDGFLYFANQIKKIKLPNAVSVGTHFMYCSNVEEVILPNVEIIGDSFLSNVINLKKLSLPKCERIDSFFMLKNKELQELNAPKLKHVGKYFLQNNTALKNVSLPELEWADDGFLRSNKNMNSINVPKLNNLLNGYTNKKISKLIKRNIKLKKKLDHEQLKG